MEPSPLSIEELLEHCISYLRDSPRDLMACLWPVLWFPVFGCSQPSLFSFRSFQAPPIFNNRSTGINGLWTRLLETLDTFPHLVRHVRHLDIRTDTGSATLSLICGFPFTHVQRVKLAYVDLAPDGLEDLQQLFSLPALLLVYLVCIFIERGEFIRLWERASPTIRHVRLDCAERTSGTAPPAATHLPTLETPIVLDSLHLESIGTLDYRWMMQPCPFDLSHLKALGVGMDSQVPWQNFFPIVQTIEGLIIALKPSHTAPTLPHLSWFPNLSFLHADLIVPWDIGMARNKALALAEQLFSGVGPTSGIRTIVIGLDFSNSMRPPQEKQMTKKTLCERLDFTLSSLPLPQVPTVELALYAELYENVRPYFQRLDSQNALYRTDRRSCWRWEDSL
ncbi:hypothetical protein C8R47DRAFT_1329245 [Mycena vitilis]|nr:hypothetical protein C8R47DRAFT_1329245 [Mycena vitilis]